MPAPIALFAFNRPDHLSQTLEALAANDLAAASALTVFCDAPRHEKEKSLTDAVRSVAAEARGFQSVSVVARERNLGCANSVITGLEEMFSRHERLVVIEDDILCSPHTLRFLNAGLKRYAAEPVVFNIAAWSPPARIFPVSSAYPYDAYFVPRSECWGWASWRDRWEKVDWDISDYEIFANTSCLQNAFNQGGEDMALMLRAQMEGRLDSWAIRMDYARFKHGCVGLNPVHSYVTNIGMGSGTHTTVASTRLDNDLALALPNPRLPDHIFIDDDILRQYRRTYAAPPLWVRGINKASRIVFGRNLIDV